MGSSRLVDGQDDIARLDHGVNLAAFFQAEVFHRRFSNDGNELLPAGQFDDNLVVHRSDDNLFDGGGDKIARTEFHVACLFHGD